MSAVRTAMFNPFWKFVFNLRTRQRGVLKLANFYRKNKNVFSEGGNKKINVGKIFIQFQDLEIPL